MNLICMFLGHKTQKISRRIKNTSFYYGKVKSKYIVKNECKRCNKRTTSILFPAFVIVER
jgi:hypothetical protein